jgi:hypothetical protein
MRKTTWLVHAAVVWFVLAAGASIACGQEKMRVSRSFADATNAT